MTKQENNKIIDDITKLAGDAFGALGNLRHEANNILTNKLEKYLENLNLVKRDEFELVKSMIVNYRIEQEKLIKRIEVLEQNEH